MVMLLSEKDHQHMRVLSVAGERVFFGPKTAFRELRKMGVDQADCGR